MRSLILLSLLLTPAVVMADDGDESSAQQSEGRDTKAAYGYLITLVDKWFAARDADNPRAVGLVDEKLVNWYKRELDDHRRDAELAPAEPEGKKKKKKKGSMSDMDMAGDMLGDAGVAKDFPRLRVLVGELNDMQEKFDRMEASAMAYLDKGRKLRELQGLAKAEITVPPPKVVAPPVAAASKASAAGGDAGGAVSTKGEEATKAAVVEPVPVEPARPKVQLLDEEEDGKKSKKDKDKKSKKDKDKDKDDKRAPLESLDDD